MREPERRDHAAVGHRHDDVGLDRGLAREMVAHGDPRPVDREVVEDAVGAGEVDVLEHAEAAVVAAQLDAAQAGVVDDEDLAEGDVADLVGLDEVEGAGLGGDDVAVGVVAQAAEHQRAEAVRVADGEQLVLGDEHEAVGALDPPERIAQALDEGRLAGCAPAAASIPSVSLWLEKMA